MTKRGCRASTSTAPDNLMASPGRAATTPPPSLGPHAHLPSVPFHCEEQCKPIIEVEIPQYAFRFPSFDRVKLATIKDSIHHPRVPAVPTLRRIDRDNELKKLSDEHIKTSLPCGKEFYEASTGPDSQAGVERVIQYTAPHPQVHDPHLVMICPELKEGAMDSRHTSGVRHPTTNTYRGTPTPSKVQVKFIRNPPKEKEIVPERFSAKEWRDFLDQDPSTYKLTPPAPPRVRDQHWIGYGVTDMTLDNGDPTRKTRDKWRRSLVGLPNNTWEGQRPIPSNTLDRFRRPFEGSETQWWTPPVSTEVWRPNHYYFDRTEPMQRLAAGPKSRPFEKECNRVKRQVYDRGLHTTN